MHRPLAILLAGSVLAACGGDGESELAAAAQPIVDHHAAMARRGFAGAAAGARALDAAIDAFVAAPSAETLLAARQAWVAARVPYRPTEAMRFYGGPIDDPADEREPRINAWPMDEAYVDYVVGNATAGIINDPGRFPSLDADTLAGANFIGGESNVAVGFHAIEFLLWGQDRSEAGPGDRPYTDYLLQGGTAANQARRRAYLGVISDLLVEDLDHVAARWADGGDYTSTFTGAPVASLTRILTGVGTLSAAELPGERMLTAYENKDQEDEHSCFSDTTVDDLRGNFDGIARVWFGHWGDLEGAGLAALVQAYDPALADEMASRIVAATAALDEIPAPFDQAILGDDAAPGRVKVLAAIRAIQAVGETVVDVAEALDVPVSTEL